ncbi:MAG: hypothetical protein EA376_07875 [Phycisphaeraceae bacterium]|nr:MAG: hypothetical protein EA376_07875 [Phycisphaeraceae bacterium]
MDRPAPARWDGRLLFAEFLRKEHARAAEKSPAGADRSGTESPLRHETHEPHRSDRSDRPGPRLADVSPTREITKRIRVEQTYQVRSRSTLGNMIDVLM